MINLSNSTSTYVRSHRRPVPPRQEVQTFLLSHFLALFLCHVSLNLVFFDVLYELKCGVFVRTRHRTLSARPSANDSRRKTVRPWTFCRDLYRLCITTKVTDRKTPGTRVKLSCGISRGVYKYRTLLFEEFIWLFSGESSLCPITLCTFRLATGVFVLIRC